MIDLKSRLSIWLAITTEKKTVNTIIIVVLSLLPSSSSSSSIDTHYSYRSVLLCHSINHLVWFICICCRLDLWSMIIIAIIIILTTDRRPKWFAFRNVSFLSLSLENLCYKSVKFKVKPPSLLFGFHVAYFFFEFQKFSFLFFNLNFTFENITVMITVFLYYEK